MPINQMNIQFINATEWQEFSWFSSGGTRAKKLLQSPDGKLFFFKCSERKPAQTGKQAKYYKYEFWNEIIVYHIGRSLGLEVLEYSPAAYENEMGCLSPMMIITDEEQLIEVGRLMTSINPNFLPESHDARKEYTFQLLTETLDHFELNEYLPFFFRTLIFDALIGNTDRHQENWAFIGKTTPEQWINKLLNRLPQMVKDRFYKSDRIYKLTHAQIFTTAPIYDNGSSLARELTNERIDLLLANEDELKQYLTKGRSELHWSGKKLTHYALINELLASSYMEPVRDASGFLKAWSGEMVEEILNKVDANVPNKWHAFRIPQNRKKLILKILNLRLNILNQLIDNGIR